MATNVDTGGHVWFKCPQPCLDPFCNFCEGGLTRCVVCGAVEGELLSHCPGYQLSPEAKEACFSGNVFDFTYLKRLRKHNPDLFFTLRKRWRTPRTV